MGDETRRQQAREDFKRARMDGLFQDMVARMRGRPDELLPFEEVRQKLHGASGVSREQRRIPLKAIIGSVGRYQDFNRDFLPRTAQDRERWASVSLAIEDKPNLPPIEVYQIGEAFFVQDGNHRVSIANRRGREDILANVTRIETPVTLSSEADMVEVIRLSEYAAFLEQTNLHEHFPDADLTLSEPGGYETLEQQVEVVHFSLQRESRREITYEEALRAWYTEYFLPTVEIIQNHNLLRRYPGRTEADLYVWLHRHRSALMRESGWEISPDAAAADLNARAAGGLRLLIQRTVSPDSGTGAWREEHLSRELGHIFGDILVLLDPEQPSLLPQALAIASEEGSHLLGLFIDPQGAGREGTFPRLRASFEQSCREAGVAGQLAYGRGDPAGILKARSRWADLAVLPAPVEGSDRKEYHRLVDSCQIPVWVARGTWEGCRRVLLAFDGSPKAKEALFLTAYLSVFWEFSVTVVTVEEAGMPPETLQNAVQYLEKYNVDTRPVQASARPVEAILEAAGQAQANLIVTGGYHSRRLLPSAIGHTLDTLLGRVEVPLLICR